MAEVRIEKASKELPKCFLIENVVRRQGTRLHRAKATTKHRFKQYIGGMRLLRNKKLSLREDVFRKEEDKIVELLKAGIVSVHTDNMRITTLPDGRYVLTKIDSGAFKILGKGEIPVYFKGGEPVTPQKTNGPSSKPTVKIEPDDLTILPNIGGTRAKKLRTRGINLFHQVASMPAVSLTTILAIDESAAAEIINAAKGRCR